MPVFRKKSEIVDARKFEGGLERGTELAFWVNANGGEGRWEAEGHNLHERIYVASVPYSKTFAIAYIGDWIIYDQDGMFKVMRPEAFEETYEQV